MVVTLSLLGGVLLGLVAGYVGGKTDIVIMRLMDVILSFLNSEVYIISSDALEGENSEVEPLVLGNAEGQPVLAVFSHPSRVDQEYLEAAPNVLGTQGAAIIANIGDELGMVINPGAAYGFEINPEGIANIKRDFKRADDSDANPAGLEGE